MNCSEKLNTSKLLTQTEKPTIKKCYDDPMYFVDQYDRSVASYSCSRPYKNGSRWVMRYIRIRFDHLLHNSYVLYKDYVQKYHDEDSPAKKLLRARSFHTFYITSVAIGLISSEPEHLPPVSSLVKRPFVSENDLPTVVRKPCEYSHAQAKRVRTNHACSQCKIGNRIRK